MDEAMHRKSFRRELKVAFLGDSGAGKSRTIARLLNDSGDPVGYDGKSTVGILTRDMEYPLKGEMVKVHFWDFSGEEALRPFCRLFMTEKTVYVVMLNSGDMALNARAGYWLRAIRSVDADAPILLVLNHIDKNPVPDIKVQYLYSICGNLEVVWLSAFRDDRDHFYSTFTVKLEEQMLKLLRQDAVCSGGKKQDVNDCIRFHKEIFRLLDIGKIGTEGGVISHSGIGRIMAPAGTHQIRSILELLRKAGLSAPAGNNAEFISALCPDGALPIAQTYAESPDALELRLHYEYLPIELLHRLMVELWGDLDRKQVRCSAAMFRERGTSVTATVQSTGDQLRICVRSGSRHKPNPYLGEIRGALLRIGSTLGLDQPEATVVYKTDGRQDMFHVEELLGRLRSGKKMVHSRVLHEMVPIRDILAQTYLDSGEGETEEMPETLPEDISEVHTRPEVQPSQADDRKHTAGQQEPIPQQKTEDKSAARRSVEDKAPNMLPSCERRVVFLGDSEAGKTLTIARLMDPDLDPETFPGNVTSGIQVSQMPCEDDGKDILVNFWDFGGQEILHSIHRIFLTDQTLYVVLLNTRQDSQDERAHFWMRYLRTYAPDSPVLLVLNKVDQNEYASVNETGLRRLNPMLKNILKLSALTYTKDQFRKALTEPLMEQLRMTDNGRTSFEREEKQIRDKIRKECAERKQISIADYRKICDEHSLHSDKQNELLVRLRDAGVFIYFDKVRSTDTYTLLDPQWITSVIYNILKEGRSPAGNGILSQSQLMAALQDDKSRQWTEADGAYALGIMEKHLLAYKMCEEEFIPMLCGREEPQDAQRIARDPNAAVMRLQFEYLPAGVLFQLIVEARAELEQENVWLSGAVFRNARNCRALVHREDDTLTIYCLGNKLTDIADYLNDLRKMILRIAKSPDHAATLRVQEIGFRVDNDIEFFDFDRLNTAKDCAEEHVISKKRGGPIAIQDILDLTDRSERRKTKQLLKDIAKACANLQENSSAIRQKEDDWNKMLGQSLEYMGYDVEAQPPVGLGKSEDRPNELDLLFYHPGKEPWLILEALNVTSYDIWKEHLKKLLGRYDVWGLPTLVLLSYANCSLSNFDKQFEKYDSFLKGYREENIEPIPNSHKRPQLFESEHAYFHTACCTYLRNGKPVTVYHYYVHKNAVAADKDN